MKRILVMGAGGFAGGYIVEEGLRRGYEVWAGVRATTSRRYLTDSRIRFIEFDFDADSAAEDMAERMRTALPEGEKWDWIIYNLGATKCLRFSDFSRINYDYLRYFCSALKLCDKTPECLLYISSLSAVGPAEEKSGKPITEANIPIPNTRYGASKLKAEMLLKMEGIPHIIFRATGIYGPRDKDYYLMFKSIKSGFDFSVGYKAQSLTFIYVEDLARAIYDALARGKRGETYNVAHPAVYTQGEFRKISAREMKKRVVIPVKVPLIGLKLVSVIAEKIGVAKGKPSTLNSDKYNIMAQRNWSVDVSKAERDFGFKPQIDLGEGVKRCVEWYKQEGWL